VGPTAETANRVTGASHGLRRASERDTAMPADGRTARSVRTREAVVEALLDLLSEGNPRPTAREIAEQAGVSVRSVYVHFDDLEDLFLAATGRLLERIEPLAAPVPSDGPLGERVTAFTARQAKVLDATAPVRLAASLQAPFSPVIARVHTEVYLASLVELERVFGTELDRLRDPDRRRLLLSLEVITSGTAWNTLRTDAHLSFAEGEALMRDHLTQLLSRRP